MAKAALMAGEHRHFEKQRANTATQVRKASDIAKGKSLTMKFPDDFLRNPAHDLNHESSAAGGMGEIAICKPYQPLDWNIGPKAPFIWHANNDLALIGIIGDPSTRVFDGYYKQSLLSSSDQGSDVTDADGVHILCRFSNVMLRLVIFCRVATGRKLIRAYHSFKTKGSLTNTYCEVSHPRVSTSDIANRRWAGA